MSDTTTGLSLLDPANEVHVRAQRRLDTEQIGWLTTVDLDGFPHAVPVWFMIHADSVVIMSEPRTAKVRNLRLNSHALFHLEAGPDGEELTVLQGHATVSERSSTDWFGEIGQTYGAKYADGLVGIELTAETMAEKYSLVIQLRPTKLITW